MNDDLQYCIIKLSQADTQTLKQVRNTLEGKNIAAPDHLISQSAAAKMLGVSRTTFWRMLKNGIISVVSPFSNMVRIRMSDVQALIAQCKEHSTTEDEQ